MAPHSSTCLGSPMDGGAWWAAVHGVSKSRTRLSDFTFTFHFHALEKEMATHSIVLAWRIPGTAEPGGLPSMGLHRVGHDWRDLAAAGRNIFLWYTHAWTCTHTHTCRAWRWWLGLIGRCQKVIKNPDSSFHAVSISSLDIYLKVQDKTQTRSSISEFQPALWSKEQTYATTVSFREQLKSLNMPFLVFH